MEGKRCETIRLNVLRKRNLAATAAGYFPQGNYLNDSPARVTNTKSTAVAVLFVLRSEGIEPPQVAKSATEGMPCDIFGGTFGESRASPQLQQAISRREIT